MKSTTILFLENICNRVVPSFEDDDYKSFRQVLKECRGNDDDSLLREFFSQHSEFGRRVFSEAMSLALDFAQEEIHRLAKIKENRELTDEEKAFARESVDGLLDNVEQICLNRLGDTQY